MPRQHTQLSTGPVLVRMESGVTSKSSHTSLWQGRAGAAASSGHFLRPSSALPWCSRASRPRVPREFLSAASGLCLADQTRPGLARGAGVRPRSALTDQQTASYDTCCWAPRRGRYGEVLPRRSTSCSSNEALVAHPPRTVVSASPSPWEPRAAPRYPPPGSGPPHIWITATVRPAVGKQWHVTCGPRHHAPRSPPPRRRHHHHHHQQNAIESIT